MAIRFSRRATSWLLLYYFTRVKGIPFAGSIFASSASSKQASESEAHNQHEQTRIPPRGDDVATRCRLDREEAGGSWLDGLELEEYDPTAHLHHHEDSSQYAEVLSSLQSYPLLQLPCRMSVKQADAHPLTSSGSTMPSDPRLVKCFCDTGAQRTVMSARSAQAAGLWAFLDRRYADRSTAVGVGGSTCRVLGRIPPGVAALHLYGHVELPSPAIMVLEDLCGVDLLLGLDFLRDHEAILDLRLEELQLTIHGKLERVPFIKPRSTGADGTQEIFRRQLVDASYIPVQQCLSTDVSDGDLEQSDGYEDDEDGLSSFREPIDMSGV